MSNHVIISRESIVPSTIRFGIIARVYWRALSVAWIFWWIIVGLPRFGANIYENWINIHGNRLIFFGLDVTHGEMLHCLLFQNI